MCLFNALSYYRPCVMVVSEEIVLCALSVLLVKDLFGKVCVASLSFSVLFVSLLLF